VVPRVGAGGAGRDALHVPRNRSGRRPHARRQHDRAVPGPARYVEVHREWRDLHPGRLVPTDGPVLRIERLVGERWDTVAWDDDRELEIRAVRSLGGRGYVWEARWHHPARAGPFRVVLVARAGLPEVTGDRVGC